jgi:heptaprenyl diphosphate synthase
MTRKVTDEADVIALLAAFSLFLSTIEFIIPKPLPFLHLGVANLAILVGLRVLRPRALLALIGIKVAAQAIMFGTLFSYTFALSVAGGLASGLAMLGIDRLLGKRISLVGVSVCGAFASNVGQIAVAALPILFGPGAWIIAPPFLLVGTVTAVILGLMAERFTAVSVWVKMHQRQPWMGTDRERMRRGRRELTTMKTMGMMEKRGNRKKGLEPPMKMKPPKAKRRV